jgi:hypothetical protein
MAITPYLLYEDVGAALRFLAKAFGFRRYGTQMKGSDGRINHAAMKLGTELIMMGCPGMGYRNEQRPGDPIRRWGIDNTARPEGRRAMNLPIPHGHGAMG